MRLNKSNLKLGRTYRVRGLCLVHQHSTCEHLGVLSYIGNTTFAFDSVDEIPRHQFRFRDYVLLEEISSNKSSAYMLDKEY